MFKECFHTTSNALLLNQSNNQNSQMPAHENKVSSNASAHRDTYLSLNPPTAFFWRPSTHGRPTSVPGIASFVQRPRQYTLQTQQDEIQGGGVKTNKTGWNFSTLSFLPPLRLPVVLPLPLPFYFPLPLPPPSVHFSFLPARLRMASENN